MTPSKAIIQGPSAERALVDSLGRKLTLRNLNALDKLRLFKAAGPELAQNPPWLGMAMIASSVSCIDEIPVPLPATEQQIEALVSRLGDSGLTAISEALETDGSPGFRQEALSAGNSLGTPT